MRPAKPVPSPKNCTNEGWGSPQNSQPPSHHPDRHRAEDHGRRTRGDGFLPFGEETAGHEHHEEREDETLGEVLAGWQVAFPTRPTPEIQEHARKHHAQAAHHERGKALNSEFDGNETRAPRDINQSEASQYLRDVFLPVSSTCAGKYPVVRRTASPENNKNDNWLSLLAKRKKRKRY